MHAHDKMMVWNPITESPDFNLPALVTTSAVVDHRVGIISVEFVA